MFAGDEAGGSAPEIEVTGEAVAVGADLEMAGVGAVRRNQDRKGAGTVLPHLVGLWRCMVGLVKQTVIGAADRNKGAGDKFGLQVEIGTEEEAQAWRGRSDAAGPTGKLLAGIRHTDDDIGLIRDQVVVCQVR